MMRAPKFWSRPDGATHPLAKFLTPAAKLYADIVARKLKKTEPIQAACQVICIGNITMGGVGKTPFADYLARQLLNQGINPHLLLRGYGGSQRGPILVTDQFTAADVGDEAKMQSAHWPVWIARDRPAGAAAAATAGADIIIMDDGFQNPSLKKDLSFILIDGVTGLGNGLVFPAGPLRELAKDALLRADAVVIVGGEDTALPIELPDHMPLLRAHIKADITPIPKNEKIIAFAGIGRPEKFFQDLKHQGVNVVDQIGFPDHHQFSGDDLVDLFTRATKQKARLVTTRKDMVRINPDDRNTIISIPAHFSIEPSSTLNQLLTPLLSKIETT